MPIRSLLLLLFFATPVAAQVRQNADAELYARGEEVPAPQGRSIVRAAIEITIDPGWHLYHEELGGPDAIGIPTTVELGGEGIEWGPVRFPEPHRYEQPGYGDVPATWILGHEGTIVLFAAGWLAEGAKAEGATVKLSGQTCAEQCTIYDQKLTVSSAGADALFAAFPADLVPKPADERGAGEADATLYTRVRDGKVLAAIEIDISSGWHLFHEQLGMSESGIPATVELGGEGIEWGPVRFPEPTKIDQFDGWAWAHHGTIVLVAEGELAAGARGDDVTAKLNGQTCSEGPQSECIRYQELAYDRGEGPDELFTAWPAATTETAAGGVSEERLDRIGLGAFLALAVFWGLFTLLMPCTYPMIPITISFFTKQADARGGKVLPLSLSYGLGIVAIFILIGVAFGSVIIPFATHPLTNLLIAAFFIVFALALFGLVDLQPPRFLLNVAGKASMTGGYAGVFVMGACLVVTSFTCTAPFVGSLLSVGAADGSLSRVVIGMGTFGLTMAVPFVLLSLVPGRIAAMPRSGEWMNMLKVTLGFVELAAAFKFLSNADLVWNWGVISRELFLLSWVLIFIGAAAYLAFFAGGRRAKLGAGRSFAAILMLLLSGYSFFGFLGNDMDRVMTAIIPNYSGGRFFPQWWFSGARHRIVLDDYDGAIEVAKNEQKLLLLNFTGKT
ncbi:MAG: protein-disulfide reductase DsbD family protein [Planctomycetota bacterium]|nr:protein-disulfide reductase DsbD family protein [Planctomycetota bacterium]